jgi:hypothetical protein
MIKRARNAWAAAKHRVKVRLGLHPTNTKKLRGRIRLAIRERRFFFYLCGTRPCLPIGVFLPLLAIPSWVDKIGLGVVESVEAVLKIACIVLTSFYVLLQIKNMRLRFKRLLRRADRVSRRRVGDRGNCSKSQTEQNA